MAINHTTNLNLNKPTLGTRNWDTYLNDNFDILDTSIGTNSNKIGILSNLATTAKDNTVNAINEVNGQLADMTNKQGDVSQLNTTDKSSIVNAIKEIKTQANSNQTSLNTTNNNLASTNTNVTNLQTQVTSLASGAPQAVSLVANMTDHTKNYVYTGSESGYTVGNWYYWNGTAWTSGGTYQSTGIADKSVTLNTLATETRSKVNFGITARAKPYMWSGGSVTKTTNSITFVGSVGGIAGVGTTFQINATTLSNLVLGNIVVVKNLDFDNTHGTATNVDAVVEDFRTLTGDEIIIAYVDDIGVHSIYDDYINNFVNTDSFNIQQAILKVKPWIIDNTAIIAKTINSFTISGNVGATYNDGNGCFFLIAPCSFTDLAIGNVIVVRDFNSKINQDGQSNPKLETQKIDWRAIKSTDILIAYVDGVGVHSIYDDYIIESNINIIKPNDYLQKTNIPESIISIFCNDILSKSYPTLAQKILFKNENINALLVGDSIFASSGAWIHDTYNESARFTNLVSIPSAEPLGLTNNILSRKIYEELISQAINIPIYRRFDYGKTFDYNSASSTYGQDITSAGASFFLETGEFHTYINSNGNKGTEGAYNSKIPMTKSDFLFQSYPYDSWYNSNAMEGFTRVSNVANASIQFTIPIGYKKCRIKLRLAIDGDTLTTTLTNCTGASSIDTKYVTTNSITSTFKDYEFIVTDTTKEATIKLEKSSDVSKLLLYWGCYYYNEPSILVNNMAYGGTNTATNLLLLNDNLNSSPESYDLIIWELMLLNDSFYDLNTMTQAISDYCNAIKDKNVIAIIPHMGTENSNKLLWNKAKSILITNNIPFIDLSSIEKQLLDYFNNDYNTLASYLYADSNVHPGVKGVSILKRPLQAMLQCNQYNKI